MSRNGSFSPFPGMVLLRQRFPSSTSSAAEIDATGNIRDTGSQIRASFLSGLVRYVVDRNRTVLLQAIQNLTQQLYLEYSMVLDPRHAKRSTSTLCLMLSHLVHKTFVRHTCNGYQVRRDSKTLKNINYDGPRCWLYGTTH